MEATKMEVLTFFSNNEHLVDYLGDFLKNYSKLEFSSTSEHTVYFKNPKTGKNEIYLHLIHHNINHEFIRDYTETEQEFVKLFFKHKEFFFFDIQFRDESFLKDLLEAFKVHLSQDVEMSQASIILSHPHKGFLTLDQV